MFFFTYYCINGSVGVALGLKGYFIQYKFILPERIKHSSYTYQKLFRALYGYTQNVTKSTGKAYKYHREGVLSKTPYMRPGKNCVIIPHNSFNQLISFFKTGKNPSHYWRGKGDWKAVYYMDEKDLDEADVISALETQIDRTYVTSPADTPQQLSEALDVILARSKESSKVDNAYLTATLADAEKVVSGLWFKEIYKKSPKLSSFYQKYRQIKG